MRRRDRYVELGLVRIPTIRRGPSGRLLEKRIHKHGGGDYRTFDHHDPSAELRHACSLLQTAGWKHWVAYGTLLGLYRDHGYLPWDNDLDIAACLQYGDVRANTELNWRVIDLFLAHGWRLQWSMHDAGQPTQLGFLSATGVSLDINVLYSGLLPGHIVEHHSWGVYVEPLWVVESVRQEQLVAGVLPVPTPMEDYLAMVYGPGWRTPAKWLAPADKVYPTHHHWLPSKQSPSPWDLLLALCNHGRHRLVPAVLSTPVVGRAYHRFYQRTHSCMLRFLARLQSAV